MGVGRSSFNRVGRARAHVLVAIAVLASSLAVLTTPEPADAASLPAGFQEQIVFSGLTEPTALRFSPDGRVFVAEKSGVIKVFDNLSDTTPTVFADLRTQVHNYWDRGLLDVALAPDFPTNPWVYVLYTFDAAIGGTAPRWGSVGGTSDDCPTPPGPTDDGCVVAGRLSRMQASGNTAVGAEQVLIEDWCQQYPSHSIGSLAFGTDGALYVSGGDGASFNFADYGQDGVARQPVWRPTSGRRGNDDAADGGGWCAAEPGPSDDERSVGLNGTILRVDPATGAGLPDNPMASSADPNARRIVAYGLRNPFRITTRPGDQRGLDRRRRLGRMGGDRPTRQPDRGARRQLRLALLRGRRPTGRVRRGEPRRLREPLWRRHQCGRGALLPVPPQRPRAAQRRLPEGRLVDRGHLLRVRQRRFVPGRVPRGAVLRRLLAPVHLGDPDRQQRTARHLQAPDVRRRRRTARRPRDRTGRRSLLRRLRGHHPPHPLLRAEPTPDRRRDRQPHERGRAPDGRLRRPRLERSRRRRAHLRLGPRRRRRVRRRRLGDRQHHLHPTRRPHRHAPRHRPLGSEQHVVGRHLGGQHPAVGGHRRARHGHHVEGRGRHHVLGPRHRPAAGHARSSRARVVPRAPALSLDVPRAPRADVDRHRERQLRRHRITSTPRTWSCG